MLFKQFTVVAIAALAASATAIPVTGSPTTTVIDPAVIALDPSTAVITRPSVPVNAGYADSNDDEENASKWGGGWGGWGCWGWPSWGCWGWPNWCCKSIVL
ncbi:hypothetical protein BGZ81_009484 [Podila clonocystis]|nr:hypothetical protein BGZ81_009484 [Podila clonocystis]